MAVAVTMPQMGESMVEGTVERWLKAPGEPVAKLEAIVEISTDKIDTEIPAPADGLLLQVMVDAGQTVRAGTVLGYIGSAGEQTLPEQAPAAVTPVSSPHDLEDRAASVAPDKRQPPSLERPTGRAFVSPVVARMAAEHQLDLEVIAGSGLHGRVTKRDVLDHLAEREAAPASSAPLPGAPSLGAVPVVETKPRVEVSADGGTTDEIWQPLTTMRRAIAQHMVQSKQTSPHVTTVFEVDMTAVVRHREQHKERYAERGVRLTYTPYFVAAAARALRLVPEVNARFHGTGEQSALVLQTRVHIGVAVALEQGLIVPVIRDADERNLQGLARAVHDLAQQARVGQLAPDATRGGTFTITNHGVTGSLLGTPIINQPQAGILGIGAIVKRPVVRSGGASLLPSADDAIVIRPMCYLSFSFDHRILDGARADLFMSAVVEQLQGWAVDSENIR
ncbi:MAG: 2-oxo acid dehydrogenase subunit E2 [Caldilineaceae bacterium]|nr:2-oxo acid dehydrogenase subunit E2 [Caldilineaceae bacterium]